MSAVVDYTGQSSSERKYGLEPSAVPSWGYSGDVQLLERREEAALVRAARAGDRRAMSRLIDANIRLIYSVARRYRCRTYSLEDLVQEGILGLMLAVERFDETRGCRLSTYALHWIRQSIARAAEQNDRLIHMPAQAKAELRQLRKLREERRSQGHEPTETELAEASGLTEERVQQLLGSVEEPVSLEASVGTEQDCLLLELAEDPDAVNPEQDALKDACRDQVRELVSCLRPRERWVVEERFGLGGGSPRTLDELSQSLRISREGVRQIEVRAIRKLRHALRSKQWD